jgi:hypothetical protein
MFNAFTTEAPVWRCFGCYDFVIDKPRVDHPAASRTISVCVTCEFLLYWYRSLATQRPDHRVQFGEENLEKP